MSDAAGLLAVVAATFALAGFVQAVSGFGSALVAVPLLTLVVAPSQAVVVSVLVAIVVSALALPKEAAHVQRPAARRLVLWALPGLPLGWLALALAPDAAVQLAVGAAVLLAVAVLVSGVRLPAGPGSQRGAGLLSGALLTSTGMNGPPLVLALTGGGATPRQARATLQAVFVVQDSLALAGFVAIGLVSWASVGLALVGGVAIRLGWLVGDRVFALLSPLLFARAVRLTLLASGAVAVWGALG